MNNRTKHTCIKEYEPDASFYEKVLEAMDETERKKIPPEKTAQMLQKIQLATMLNCAEIRCKKQCRKTYQNRAQRSPVK